MLKMTFFILNSLLLLLLCLFYSVYSDCSTQTPTKLKTYVINLDLEPRLRFQEVSNDFKDQMAVLVNAQKKQIDPIAIPILEEIASDVDNYLPYPFNEELKGIANATGLNLGDIVVANLIYDITAFCTSIVAQQIDGKIIHGRNLDYNFQQYLTNLTFIAEFHRNGKLLFTTAQTAGYIGILTGHKKDAFTFTIDERDQGAWWVNFLFALLDKKAKPLPFISREIFENATDFNAAIAMLSSTDLIAPAYFIIGGVKPYEGAVITRSQGQVIDIWRLNATSKGIESWYLLETNYDHWVPPPSNDDRRTPGMKAMNATGQANINSKTILNVLSVHPVCNPSTVYSIYMSAAEDNSNIKIIVRYD